MEILLLGGTGTLSSAVLSNALDKGYNVTVMNRGSKNNALPDTVKTIICDFTDNEGLCKTFCHQRYDVVVDFLSRTPVDIERVYSVFKDNCKQYIFISSACVYRRASEDFPLIENSPKPNRDWSYNILKYESEQKLIELSKDSQSYYTIVRPYITYDDERIPIGISPAYRFCRTIIERIRVGKPWFVWDDGNAITTLTYAAEFAYGVVGLFFNAKAVNTDFHITSGYQYSQLEVINTIFKKLDRTANVVNIPSCEIVRILPEYKGILLGDRALSAVFDNSKIKDAVPDLRFAVSLEKGLDKVFSYWERLDTYDYDYKFDARIDKLISTYGVKVGYVKYPGSSRCTRLIYMAYRYLPLRVAKRITRHLK